MTPTPPPHDSQSTLTPDVWEVGAAYEFYIGRWSRVVAAHFIRWLAIKSHATWLDFGCGTGALGQTIAANARPASVVCCDRSPGFIEFARQRTTDRKLQFVAAELPHLPQTPGGFDAVVSALVLNFLPSPIDGLAAMAAQVKPGGTVASYVWDYAGGMQMLRVFWDAAIAVDPGATSIDEGVRFPLCQPEPLRQLFESAGLLDVEVSPIDTPIRFRTFDDYWTPFLGGQGPAPSYLMGSNPAHRNRIRDAIRERLPTSADGSIELNARAWAARGRRG